MPGVARPADGLDAGVLAPRPDDPQRHGRAARGLGRDAGRDRHSGQHRRQYDHQPDRAAPGDVSTADAPPSTVAVLITPHRNSLKGAVEIGTIAAPRVPQNSLLQISQTFTLPSRPAGFGAGGKFYVRLVANATNTVVESNPFNNVSRPIPVSIAPVALPELRVTSLGVPAGLSPGDTITPTISIANLGTAATQGTFQVALVTSVTPSFTLGSAVIALYDVTTSIPGASSGSDNVYTFTAPSVALSPTPATYYLGVVIDPYGKIQQLSLPRNALQQIHLVTSATGLPPAGTVTTANNNPFPEPPNGTFIGIQPTTNL